MVLEININGDHHARKQQKRMKSYTVTTKRQEDGNRAYSQLTNGNLFCHIIFQASLGTLSDHYQHLSENESR